MHQAITARLIWALIAVESGGNDAAVGDGGKAVGCLQIRPAVIRDVNDMCARGGFQLYKLEDRLDRIASIVICSAYLHYYLDKWPKATERDAAMLWNGGPNYRKASAEKRKRLEAYWRKVQREIKKGVRQ